MGQTKTQNSYLGNKIGLRMHDLPAEPSVLDCFGGEGLIWKAIESAIGRPVRRIGIDKQDWDVGFYLPGDNLGYLQTMDLSRFNIIDLDAWGVPYEQLKVLFQRGYKGRVFVTFIQSLYGQMPHGLLEEIGFTREMVEVCPTLFGKRGWQYFLEWLAKNGVREVRHRSHAGKHYLAFDLQAEG